jgi:hypothetical protein
LLSEINESKLFPESLDWKGKNLLMMSSGNFDGLDLKTFSKKLRTS